MRRRKWFWPVLVLLALVLFISGWLYSDTAAFWLGWQIPMWNITKVAIRFDQTTVSVNDHKQIARLRNAVLKGNGELPYVTGGASDKYTLTFHRVSGSPLVIEFDIDDPVSFYCPSLNKTFHDKGHVMALASNLTGLKFPFEMSE